MAEVLQLFVNRMDSPIGKMLVAIDRDGNLRALDWTDHEARMRRLLRLHYSGKGFQLEPTVTASPSFT
jgi:methylated-DNA-[protein]-cysteine S-methyltransferase